MGLNGMFKKWVLVGFIWLGGFLDAQQSVSVDSDFVQRLTTLKAQMDTKSQQILKDPIFKRTEYSYTTYLVALQFDGDVQTHLSGARTLLEQVPLFQDFSPQNEPQAHLLENLKEFEALHLLALLDNSDAQPTQIAQNFLDSLNFFYAPLFNAHKQGLDPLAYLEALRINMATYERTCQNCPGHVLRNYGSSLDYYVRFNPNGMVANLVRDVRDADNAYQQLLTLKSAWAQVAIASILQQDVSHLHHYESFASLLAQPPLAKFKIFSALYLARILNLVKDIDVYVDLQDVSPDLLRERPTICLNPQYLTPSLIHACQQVLHQHKDTKALQDQLKILRLFAMEDTPCIYLDRHDEIVKLHSKNAICKALQKHLTKEF
ncbi:hypothetical protein [Helicobacter mehlei]|uniref:Uncharacterized protein n=1 Tax=Helicobacter mehlei TaxID=2316080 RepID=A0A553UU83_9HELI|nr:hypothetical protein [Helicobacter mehlei]TSA83770.1 hypothetical protein FNE76_04860 [Helicobacter mehlei]